jgi:preprotein translocase subunit SecA
MAGRGTDIKLGEGVVELGGLRVIGTERHESRRIDNQLRGRSGRQGDPGSSKFYISLEDDFIRHHSGDRMKNVMSSAGLEPGERIEGGLVSSSIAQAQHGLEQKNFDKRKHVLEYDDVMNQQRKIIYQYRKEILESVGGSDDIVREFIGDVVESCTHQVLARGKMSAEELDHVLRLLVEAIGVRENFFRPDELPTSVADFIRHVVRVLWEHFLNIRAKIAPEMVTKIERWILLETIDFAWRTHLNNLDQIKDGINFRGYAQRDPLTEYKRESFYAFERMMVEIKTRAVEALFKIDSAVVSNEALDNLRKAREEELEQISMSGPSEDGDARSAGSQPSPATPAAGNRKARRLKK